jgi:hypothetical protein
MLNMYGTTRSGGKDTRVQKQFSAEVIFRITDQKKRQVKVKFPQRESCHKRALCSLLGLLLGGLGNIFIGRLL